MNRSTNPVQAFIDGFSAGLRAARSRTQMTLGGMIVMLETLDPARPLVGPGKPHSYRGYYADLAFKEGLLKSPDFAEREEYTTTVGEFLTVCRECLGKTFTGYKGGDFTMDTDTPLWLSAYGIATGNRIMGLDASTDPVTLVTAYEKEPS